MGIKKKIAVGVVVGGALVGVPLGGMWLLGKAYYEGDTCAYLEQQAALVELTGRFVLCEYQLVDSALLDDRDTYKLIVTGERQLVAVYATSTRSEIANLDDDVVVSHHSVLAVTERGDEVVLAGERPPVVALRPFRDRPAAPMLPAPRPRWP